MTHQPSQPKNDEPSPPLYIRQYAVQLDDARKDIECLRNALVDAKAALIKIRGCSIVGAEEGYGKPEVWAEDLFRSHGDVASALKTIDTALSYRRAKP